MTTSRWREYVPKPCYRPGTPFHDKGVP